MSLSPSGRIRFLVTGARGATFADVARGSGAFGAQPNDSDAEVSQKFADYAIQENPGFKGDQGEIGSNVQSAGAAETFADAVAIQSNGLNTRQVIADGYETSGDLGGGLWVNTDGEVATPSFTETRAAKKTKDNYVLRLPKNEPIRLSRFGVRIASGNIDQQPALQDAFDIAREEGYTVVGDPYATYRKDAPIELASSFDGQGCVFRAISEADQAITVRGGTKKLRLANFTHLLGSVSRSTAYESCGLAIGDQGRDQIVDVYLENIEVNGVEAGRGPAGAAFWFANLRNLVGVGLIARNSRADGFHFVHGARHCRLYSPIAENVGDDGVAVVSYRSTGLMCEDIEVHGAYVFQGGARGVSCVGGRDIWFLQPRVDRSSAAAGYINSEDAFDTFGCWNAHIVGIKATNCAQGGGAVAPGTMQAILLLGGRAGSDDVDGYTISRSAVDCSISGHVYGAGVVASQGLAINPFVVRPRIDVDVSDIAANIPAVYVSGEDADVKAKGRNLGGLPIVIDPNTSGRTVIREPKFDNARLANPAADACILLNNAPNITQLRVENGEFNNVSGNLVNTDSGFDLKRLRYRAVKINGAEKGKDYATGAPAFISGWSSSDLLIARYADGRVTVKGAVAGGTGRDLLNLPVGFRPPVFRIGTGVTNNAAIVLTVDQNTGKITITTDPVVNEAIFIDMSFEGAN